jgi:hypothetical protein
VPVLGSGADVVPFADRREVDEAGAVFGRFLLDHAAEPVDGCLQVVGVAAPHRLVWVATSGLDVGAVPGDQELTERVPGYQRLPDELLGGDVSTVVENNIRAFGEMTRTGELPAEQWSSGLLRQS